LGHYEVYVYIPWGANRTRAAHYYLKHEGDVAEFTIDQQAKAGQWVSLGTFTFNADGTEFIHLEAATKEPADTRTVAFDAVKFVYRTP
jgi:IS4 transposase